MGKNGGARPGAGRKLGSAGNHTLQAQEAKKIMVAVVHANIGMITGKLIEEAEKGNIIAIKELLDRGFGRPVQSVNLSDEEGNSIFNEEHRIKSQQAVERILIASSEGGQETGS